MADAIPRSVSEELQTFKAALYMMEMKDVKMSS